MRKLTTCLAESIEEEFDTVQFCAKALVCVKRLFIEHAWQPPKVPQAELEVIVQHKQALADSTTTEDNSGVVAEKEIVSFLLGQQAQTSKQ
jgi:hypothetical protein